MSYNDNGSPPSVERDPGGFVADPPTDRRPTPDGADSDAWKTFDSIDDDRLNFIGPAKLQDSLLIGGVNGIPFDHNTVNLLMNIFDKDKNGLISFEEFAGLWKYIEGWKKVFNYVDRDGSGTIDDEELQSALTTYGYEATPELLDILRRKYEPSVNSADQKAPRGISFDCFVRACVVLTKVDKAFKALGPDREGWATINHLTLLRIVLSMP